MAIAPAEATLRSIFARAMPPGDRLALGGNAGDGPDVARLVAAWKASVGRDPDTVARAMATLGFDDDALARMLSPVVLEDGTPLPSWARTVERALGEDASPAFAPADGALAPFLAVARADLLDIVADLPIAVTDSAQDGLLDALRVRLWRAVSPTLEHEKQLLNATSLLFAAEGGTRIDASIRGWRSRLETYPVLAYIVGTVIDHWRPFAGEVLQRASADAPLLSRRLFGDAPVAAITSITSDAGDLHNGGRSVAILTFDTGHKAVYKPKDLTVAVAYMTLVERLNRLGLPLALPTRIVLPREGYSWEEHVAPEGCADAAGIARFYTRMGETIRLFQLLEARDFWLDNLIAQGEYPQFVDLEMLVQPRVSAPASLSPAERSAWAALEETAHRTAAVGMPMPIAQGAPSEELGALAGPGPFASPFRFEMKALAEEADLPRLTAEGHVLWDHSEHVPHIDGDFADSASYLDEVIAGYRAMQECLADNTDAVLDAVQAFRETPVRYIYRDTWTCLKFIQHSVHPGLLTDAAYREIFLSRLYGPVIESEPDGDRVVRVVRREIDSLRALDVPFFQSVPESRDLKTNGHDVVEGYFPQGAFERLEHRVADIGLFALESEVDAVRSSFACGRALGAVDIAVASNATGDMPKADDLMALATDLASNILESSIGHGRAWLGLTYHPPIDCGAFDVLRPDILTGTTGLAVLFADLFRCTGEQRWHTAANRALESTHSAWEAWERHPDRGPRHGVPTAGAFYGSGSWLYGAARVADALGDDALRATVDRRASSMVAEKTLDELTAVGDVADGPVGLLLAALKVVPGSIDPSLTASRLISALEAKSGYSQPPPRHRRKTDCAMTSLPQSLAGTALALGRLLDLLPMAEADSARRLLGRWATRSRAGRPGATLDPGTIAVMVALGKVAVPDPGWREAAREWMEFQADTSDPYRLLDVIEMELLIDDPAARTTGEAALQRLLGIRQETGTWFPGTQAPDRHNLSIIFGVPAIAHALARWSCAGALPSIRLVT